MRAVFLPEKGRGRALKQVWSASDVAGAGLHGRGPLHRPERPAARWSRRCSPGTPTWPSARRLAPRVADPARPEAGADLARLQPAAARHAAGRLLRRAVRLQGDPRATWRASCCRWWRTPPGSSTPSCWSSPSGPACGSTRSPWTGWTTRTAASTSGAPPGTTYAASLRLGWALLRGRMPLAEVTVRLGRTADAGAAGAVGSQVALFAVIGVLSTVAYAVLYLLLRGCLGAVLGERDRAGAHRGGEHRREPPDHLRGPRPQRRGPAPGAGAGDLRGRPRA